jgi:thioredoxin reductase
MLEAVIIGAGPYGLSIAAHFRRRGIPFRIFGRPMDSWRAHMPKGMRLKSDGFASNIYDPESAFTLKQFCAEKGIEYSDAGLPVRLDTFVAYGLAFRERMVPELEDTTVLSVDRVPEGFLLCIANGETVTTKRLVLAIGISHFEHTPYNLAHLPPEVLSHSFHHHDLQPFKGRKVVVIGGGSSAIDIAGLLHEADADVTLVARRTSLTFHTKTMGEQRSWWQQIRHPKSGLGPGLKTRFFSDAPMLFHFLPEHLRIEAVRRTLGPTGGWFAKDMVIGRVPLVLGYTPEHAEVKGAGVRLLLRASDGSQREEFADHIIAATGYKVDMGRLTFLSPEIRSKLKTVNDTPVLSSGLESSVPGLYFAGLAAANSFGPVMRFAFGAGFAARNLTRVLARSLAKGSVSVPAPGPVNVAEQNTWEPMERPALGSDRR